MDNAYVASGAWQSDKMIPESQDELSEAAVKAGMTAYINQGLITPNVKDLDAHYQDHKVAMALLADLEVKRTPRLRTGLQYLYENGESPVEGLIKYAWEFRDRYSSDQLFISGIKIHPEDVWDSHAYQQLEPFADQPDNYGPVGISAERVREVIMSGNEAGLDISVHTDGSRTNQTTIDSFMAVKAAGYTDARNALQHDSLVHPDDMQQIRTAIDGAIRVSVSADVPGSPQCTLPPLLQCEAGITRLDPTNSEADTVFPPPSQAITVEQCLKAITIDAAWQMRMEDKIGSLEVGKMRTW